ncbi:MAG: UDP-N-acetylmuramoyl-tripeptide--D-alanyl-D-alanine ligase [Thiotrichales bacterium]|nr:UDP-N-acetylmuramoyl-tripeptide--D-alanyl-D-alanine ligase [Thiotrichales bacterium]
MQSEFFWTLEQLLKAVGGSWLNPEVGSRSFRQVATDSRELDEQSLFIVLRGQKMDAHQFLSQAVQAKTPVCLISDQAAWAQLKQTLKPSEFQPAMVWVGDTRLALADFARWHRQQMPVKKLIGVTGSNGKTSSKTLLLQIFAQAGKTLATQGNLNNDFGVPRTLLQLRPEHEYAIIEMGANHRGEIRYLTQIAQPDLTLITNAAGAHLEGFGSLQGVIDTKGEIIESLDPEQGIAVFNAQSPGIQDWLQKCQRLGIVQVALFNPREDSILNESFVGYRHFQVRDESIYFELYGRLTDGEVFSTPISMNVLGEHHAINASACVLLGLLAGLSLSQILQGLMQFSGVPGRLQKAPIACGFLLDDSYNANPESVKAGLAALMALPGQHIACLGAMGELGAFSAPGHREVAEYAAKLGVDALLVYGDAAKQMPMHFLANATPSPAFAALCAAYPDHASMIKALDQHIEHYLQTDPSPPALHLLVKGSRTAQMERIVEALVSRWGLSQPA